MTGKTRRVVVLGLLATIVMLFTPKVISDDNDPIPPDRSQIWAWFERNVQGLSERVSTLDRDLVKAERFPIRLKVSQDGSGQFYKVQDAINSIPGGNTRRYIVEICGGTYFEKIWINYTQPFVTLLGHPSSRPILVFNDTAESTGGTVNSAAVTIYGDYFVANHIIFQNSAPMQHPGQMNRQALAVGAYGDKAAFYNSDFLGFQDTVGIERFQKHYYMYCYIEGTIDFVWGHGKALFVSTTLAVRPGLQFNAIAANYRESPWQDSGFSFVHSNVTGQAHARNTVLGRGLTQYATVIYSYTVMSDVILPQGWTRGIELEANSNQVNEFNKTVFYREYKNRGDGAARSGSPYGSRGVSQELHDNEINPYISLSFVKGSKWLLPPPW